LRVGGSSAHGKKTKIAGVGSFLRQRRDCPRQIGSVAAPPGRDRFLQKKTARSCRRGFKGRNGRGGPLWPGKAPNGPGRGGPPRAVSPERRFRSRIGTDPFGARRAPRGGAAPDTKKSGHRRRLHQRPCSSFGLPAGFGFQGCLLFGEESLGTPEPTRPFFRPYGRPTSKQWCRPWFRPGRLRGCGAIPLQFSWRPRGRVTAKEIHSGGHFVFRRGPPVGIEEQEREENGEIGCPPATHEECIAGFACILTSVEKGFSLACAFQRADYGSRQRSGAHWGAAPAFRDYVCFSLFFFAHQFGLAESFFSSAARSSKAAGGACKSVPRRGPAAHKKGGARRGWIRRPFFLFFAAPPARKKKSPGHPRCRSGPLCRLSGANGDGISLHTRRGADTPWATRRAGKKRAFTGNTPPKPISSQAKCKPFGFGPPPRGVRGPRPAIGGRALAHFLRGYRVEGVRVYREYIFCIAIQAKRSPGNPLGRGRFTMRDLSPDRFGDDFGPAKPTVNS